MLKDSAIFVTIGDKVSAGVVVFLWAASAAHGGCGDPD
jgi:hypothetical protein